MKKDAISEIPDPVWIIISLEKNELFSNIKDGIILLFSKSKLAKSFLFHSNIRGAPKMLSREELRNKFADDYRWGIIDLEGIDGEEGVLVPLVIES